MNCGIDLILSDTPHPFQGLETVIHLRSTTHNRGVDCLKILTLRKLIKQEQPAVSLHLSLLRVNIQKFNELCGGNTGHEMDVTQLVRAMESFERKKGIIVVHGVDDGLLTVEAIDLLMQRREGADYLCALRTAKKNMDARIRFVKIEAGAVVRTMEAEPEVDPEPSPGGGDNITPTGAEVEAEEEVQLEADPRFVDSLSPMTQADIDNLFPMTEAEVEANIEALDKMVAELETP